MDLPERGDVTRKFARFAYLNLTGFTGRSNLLSKVPALNSALGHEPIFRGELPVRFSSKADILGFSSARLVAGRHLPSARARALAGRARQASSHRFRSGHADRSSRTILPQERMLATFRSATVKASPARWLRPASALFNIPSGFFSSNSLRSTTEMS